MNFYRTEQMDKILKSPEANKIIGQVSPIYGESVVGLWLFEAIGAALDEMLAWCLDYQKQTVPQTATYTLPIWEKENNLPTIPGMTEEERQKRLVTEMRIRAPMAPAKLLSILSRDLAEPSVKMELIENTAPNRFDFIVHVGEQPINYRKITNRLNQLIPAHLYYRFVLQAVYEFVHEIRIATPRVWVKSGFYVREGAADLLLEGSWRLDGQYHLNGLRVLDFQNITDYYPVQIRFLANIQSKAVSKSLLRFGYSTEKHHVSGTTKKIGTRSFISCDSGSRSRVEIGTKVVEKVEYGGTLLQNIDMWRLDGDFLLNGRKALNAQQQIAAV